MSLSVVIVDSRVMLTDLAAFRPEPCCMKVSGSAYFKLPHLVRGSVSSDRGGSSVQ